MAGGDMALAPRGRKLGANLVGLMLSAAAAACFTVGAYFETHAVGELTITARRVLALTEVRIDQVTEALEELAHDRCTPAPTPIAPR